MPKLARTQPHVPGLGSQAPQQAVGGRAVPEGGPQCNFSSENMSFWPPAQAESLGSAAFESWPPPQPLKAWRGDPPPSGPTLGSLLPWGSGAERFPHSPTRDSLTPTWKEALALFAQWGRYSVPRPLPDVGWGG